MNKYINIFFSLFIVGSLFTSCDLDRLPESDIAEPEAMITMADAQNWDNGLFAYFRGRQYGVFTFYQDVQADQLNAVSGFGNRSGTAHNWVFVSTDGTLSSLWSAYYRAIANANHIIATNRNLVETRAYVSYRLATQELNDAATVANRAALDQFLGNAHFVRAFYYSQLALRWSEESFNPATAATALSVPIVTEFDVTYRPERATLQQVYNFILEDIAEARRLLAHVPLGNTTPRATRFNSNVVNALEARVALYMQNWTRAYELANSLIVSGRYPLETTVGGMKNLWLHDNSNEVIMQSHIAAPLELPSAMGFFTNNHIYVGFDAVNNQFRPDFLPSQWVIDMFEGTSSDTIDIRRPIYFTMGTVNAGGVIADSIYVISKFRGNPAITGSQISNPGVGQASANAQAPKAFRIAEMYLIAAEAAFRLGNEANALTALNTLRTARGLSAVTASGDALFQEIKDERFRELAFEGFRLFDLRRWGLGFERREPQNTTIIPLGDVFERLSISADNYRFVWGIPDNDVMINRNIVQNRGW